MKVQWQVNGYGLLYGSRDTQDGFSAPELVQHLLP
ncbi:hypothetical protein J2Z84_002333 [Agrobacterium rubi]|nr:hypothetical protein [Agrobacterium rubi]